MTPGEVQDCWDGNAKELRVLDQGLYKGQYVGLVRMAYTHAVMVLDFDTANPITRWCYESRFQANKALAEWSGIDDPSGDWIVQKPGDRKRVKGPFDE